MSTIEWHEMQMGNAHVSDGCMGFWAEFPVGTSAEAVLEEYMSTADYSSATRRFVVLAEIEGRFASRVVQPAPAPTEPEDRSAERAEYDV